MEKKNDRNVFIYHPDPMATGAFQAGDAICDCCKSSTGIYYTGPFYAKTVMLFVRTDSKRCGGKAISRLLLR